MINEIRDFLEKYGFEVIERVSSFVGLRASQLRIFFIYLCFFTLGIAFAFYVILAFFLWLKDSFIIKRKSVFDL